jgi:phospholipid transport system substrate-binding protein
VFAACLCAAPALRAAESVAAVETFQTTLLDTMKHAAALGCSGRQKMLQPVIDQRFDIPAMARYTLRRDWGQLGEAQQQAFTAAFDQLVAATYAGQFDGYAGERFEMRNTDTVADGTRVVHVQFIPAHAAAVAFDYVLHDAGGQWKIINVIADGVSDLALRAAQYHSYLHANGAQALIDSLRQQAEKACQ